MNHGEVVDLSTFEILLLSNMIDALRYHIQSFVIFLCPIQCACLPNILDNLMSSAITTKFWPFFLNVSTYVCS